MEERDTANQTVFGSGDERICPLLNLAVYLEVMAHESGDVEALSDLGWLYGDGTAENMHRQIRRILKKIWGTSLGF